MNMKTLPLLCLIFLVLASPIAATAATFGTLTSDVRFTKRSSAFNTESWQHQPTGGDPVGGDFPPGTIP